MTTLILTPRFTEDAQALWRAAVRLGWDVERLTSWRVPEHLRSAAQPVLYLEALFAPTIAEQLGLRLSEPPEDWLPRLPEVYRKRQVRLGTLAEARTMKEPAFVKPPNDKCFPARVYRGHELPTEYAESMPVLIAEVVDWTREFRCFILDRELRTFSVYLREGELQRETGFTHSGEEAHQLRGFLMSVLDDERVDLPRAAVLDLGVIRDRGWAVVEQNAAWGSGIYGCDPVEVLHVLLHATEASEGARSEV
jgi:hypothetical protein